MQIKNKCNIVEKKNNSYTKKSFIDFLRLLSFL